mmetsp:Transcript_24488/g.73542  ORF Transcript_24488/g.73542 Transcript_24488/m.73542 type:complete len:254 (-) Transcript_24488:704-1465(-)
MRSPSTPTADEAARCTLGFGSSSAGATAESADRWSSNGCASSSPSVSRRTAMACSRMCELGWRTKGSSGRNTRAGVRSDMSFRTTDRLARRMTILLSANWSINAGTSTVAASGQARTASPKASSTSDRICRVVSTILKFCSSSSTLSRKETNAGACEAAALRPSPPSFSPSPSSSSCNWPMAAARDCQLPLCSSPAISGAGMKPNETLGPASLSESSESAVCSMAGACPGEPAGWSSSAGQAPPLPPAAAHAL